MSDWLSMLVDHDVSVWLDALSRGDLAAGRFADLVHNHHVSGVTTNPTIFRQALKDGEAYHRDLDDLLARAVAAEEGARLLMASDVRAACDVLLAEYARTGGRDGRVSFEVNPHLADDAPATVAEARALAWLVDRPNLMVKIPATQAGLAAISQATAEGINVDVTLIFGLEQYKAVVDAYLTGLEAAAAAGLSLASITSVASMFVSRVDAFVDGELEANGTPDALALRGRAAVANAYVAYGHFREVTASRRWAALASAGAQPQRLLWASTGVKDDRYPPTKYVSGLVATNTVNTMPKATLAAVMAAEAADAGRLPNPRCVIDGLEAATTALAELAALGVDMDDVAARLQRQGVSMFAASWAELLAELQRHGLRP